VRLPSSSSGQEQSLRGTSGPRQRIVRRRCYTHHRLLSRGASCVGKTEELAVSAYQGAIASRADGTRCGDRCPLHVLVELVGPALPGLFRRTLVLQQVDQEHANREVDALVAPTQRLGDQTAPWRRCKSEGEDQSGHCGH